MTELSRREEIATRLACAMLANNNPMMVAAVDRLPYDCAKLASEIIEECDACTIVARDARLS